MTYYELPLPASIPVDDRHFIKDHVEPYLRDAHAMLRLPVPGLEAACRLSVAQILLSVVSGVSVTLHDPNAFEGDRVSGKCFKEVLTKRYPWDEESYIPQARLGAAAADHLYQLLRNPLAHALGGVSPQRHAKLSSGLMIIIEKGSIPEEAIESDERATSRPTDADDWRTKPTLREEPGHCVLWVRSFYWGVRKMILNVAAARMRGGITTLPPMTPTQQRTT